MRLFKTLRLASRDYAHEWQMSGCFVLALAAVLGPMMVLFGLKFGIVGGMVEQLVEDPENREVRPVISGRFDRDWFGNMARRSDVAFIVPLLRSMTAGRWQASWLNLLSETEGGAGQAQFDRRRGTLAESLQNAAAKTEAERTARRLQAAGAPAWVCCLPAAGSGL